MSENSRYDITALRARMNGLQGQRYWRGLEELADTQEFQEFLHREFPEDASVWEDGVSRRNFLKLMGASLALAGLSACTRQPEEKNRAVCAATRANHPRQAALFCDRNNSQRIRYRDIGRKSHGTPHKD